MPELELIRRRLEPHRPRLAERGEGPLVEAAVALALHEAPRAAEILLIERAQREGDPWSGQMAFPGGRRDANDLDLEHTAVRETLEEVGFDPGRAIARLDDFEGSNTALRPQRLIVSPYVHLLDARPSIATSHEVRSTVWVPLRELAEPARAVRYRFQRGEYTGDFPAIEYAGHTIWGLTYRILRHLFELLGTPLPEPGSGS